MCKKTILVKTSKCLLFLHLDLLLRIPGVPWTQLILAYFLFAPLYLAMLVKSRKFFWVHPRPWLNPGSATEWFGNSSSFTIQERELFKVLLAFLTKQQQQHCWQQTKAGTEVNCKQTSSVLLSLNLFVTSLGQTADNHDDSWLTASPQKLLNKLCVFWLASW